MDTIATRSRIGFPDRDGWMASPAEYTEHSLRIASHPVMEDWEAGYMSRLATIATAQGGRVLEVGYGLGLSARAIQATDVKSHVVIECHPDVVARCMRDHRPAVSGGKLQILCGFWQDVTPLLQSESFDGILFDTYPLKEEEVHANHFWFFDEAFRLLKRGGILTYYSDEQQSFSDRHLAKLIAAGFTLENIRHEICSVQPPESCEYWRHATIVAPVVQK